MMRYHCCSHCGMFTAMKKERCLYCGCDLRSPKDESIGAQIFSSLRALWSRTPQPKARQKLQDRLRAHQSEVP